MFEYYVLPPLFHVVSVVWKGIVSCRDFLCAVFIRSSVTLGRKVYIKQTRLAYEEAANIRFIRRSTPIPVPRVFLAFHIPAWAFWWQRKWSWGEKVPHTSDAFIFMERIDGRSLDAETWLSLDDAARNLILSQLRLFISEMRSLCPPPSTAIGSVGGAVVDDRLAQGWSSRMDFDICGPYQDEADMNLALRRQQPLSQFGPSVIASHQHSHPLVFTHGDIALRNIMIRDRAVVALIDWEAAGWFPAHWEYLKAHWVPVRHEGERLWRGCVGEVMTPYEQERKADLDLLDQLSKIN